MRKHRVDIGEVGIMLGIFTAVGGLLGIVTGGLVNDEDIQIEGIDPGASLAEIAESLNLDSSLVTSRAMAETLSAVAERVSNDVSSTGDSNMSPAIDPNTGSAPLPPGS